MRIYYSGQDGNKPDYAPERVLRKQNPSVMLSYWILQTERDNFRFDNHKKRRKRKAKNA